MKARLTSLIGTLLLLALTGCCSSKPKVSQDARAICAQVSDGRLLYEMGKLELAEQKLLAALAVQPDSAEARYYLDLVHQSLQSQRRQPWGFYQTYPQQPIY